MPFHHTAEEARAIAAKWYRALRINPRWDEEFYRALEAAPLPDGRDPVAFAAENPTGVEALIVFLYHAEALAERYRAAGIGEDILLATLDDLRIYTEEWSAVKGKLTFGTATWFKRHYGMTLFRLGRLQFGMTPSPVSAPSVGLVKGDATVDVHIPRGGRLSPEECRASFLQARVFLAKHFPDYSYAYFTCNSWLLDPTLIEFLPRESNIIEFGNTFHRVYTQTGNYMLDYLYPIGTTLATLPDVTPTTRLAAAVKDALLAGRKFYPSFGVIPADFFDCKK